MVYLLPKQNMSSPSLNADVCFTQLDPATGNVSNFYRSAPPSPAGTTLYPGALTDEGGAAWQVQAAVNSALPGLYNIATPQSVGGSSAAFLINNVADTQDYAGPLGDCVIETTLIPTLTGQDFLIVGRYNVAAGVTSCYAARLLISGTTLIAYVSRYRPDTGVWTSWGQSNSGTTFVAGTAYRLTLSIKGTASASSSAVVTVRLSTDAAPATFLATVSQTDTGDGGSYIGATGGWGISTINGAGGTCVTRLRSWAIPSGFAAGMTQTLWATPTSATVERLSPTGGTGPFTYQWQKSADPNGTFVNIPSATTPVYTDGSLSGEAYYQCIVTDTGNANATATSGLTAAFPMQPPLVIGEIGHSWDVIVGSPWSTNHDGSLPSKVPERLEPLYGNRRVYSVNKGVSGTTTNDWLPTNSTIPSGYTANYFNTAMAAFIAAGVKYVYIRLFVNDARTSISVSTVQTNMTAICAAITAQGMTPIVEYAPYFTSAGGPALDFLRGYNSTVMPALLAAGAKGGASTYEYFASFPHLIQTNLHPNNAGGDRLAAAEALAIYQADVHTVVSAGTGGGTGGSVTLSTGTFYG
jgi:hypothetical protein